MKKVLFAPILYCALAALSACVRINSEAAKTLVEVSKEGERKEEFLAQEEENFQNVMKAARGGRLSQRISRSRAKRRFGEPVLISQTPEGERWVYKSKEGGWFRAPKIYLFFNEEGRLKHWKCIRSECQ